MFKWLVACNKCICIKRCHTDICARILFLSPQILSTGIHFFRISVLFGFIRNSVYRSGIYTHNEMILYSSELLDCNQFEAKHLLGLKFFCVHETWYTIFLWLFFWFNSCKPSLYHTIRSRNLFEWFLEKFRILNCISIEKHERIHSTCFQVI